MSLRAPPSMLALFTLLAAAGAPSTSGAAQLVADSPTATSITGDITIDDRGIVFGNGQRLDFEGRSDRPFRFFDKTYQAVIHTVRDPGAPVRLLNGYALCGDAPITYLVTFRWAEDTLLLAFDTPDMPADEQAMCASYTYVDP